MRACLLMLACALVSGCKPKNKVPRNIITPDSMKVVLWDMMRADQFLADYVFPRDSTNNRKERSFDYYRQIFALHKISREEFQRSFDYYRAHPDLMKKVMDSIVYIPPSEPYVSPAIADSIMPAPPVVKDTNIENPAISAPMKIRRKALLDSIARMRRAAGNP